MKKKINTLPNDEDSEEDEDIEEDEELSEEEKKLIEKRLRELGYLEWFNV